MGSAGAFLEEAARSLMAVQRRVRLALPAPLLQLEESTEPGLQVIGTGLQHTGAKLAELSEALTLAPVLAAPLTGKNALQVRLGVFAGAEQRPLEVRRFAHPQTMPLHGLAKEIGHATVSRHAPHAQ